ncbi:MAG: hypothetical protein JWP86_1743, partial [Phenylobacterium sp.]|nr:hypothetical protein [Phenylobacterium sp.]
MNRSSHLRLTAPAMLVALSAAAGVGLAQDAA